MVRLELGNMEHGVDTAHARRELESDGMRAGMSNDLIRSKVFLRELLGGTMSLNELGKEESFGPDRKLGSGFPVTIRGNLISSTY